MCAFPLEPHIRRTASVPAETSKALQTFPMHDRKMGDNVGLGNVDERLRTAYGDDSGLVVETAPGAGTKVIVRVPKFAAGVRP